MKEPDENLTVSYHQKHFFTKYCDLKFVINERPQFEMTILQGAFLKLMYMRQGGLIISLLDMYIKWSGTALCSCAGHFTLPLTTQVYKCLLVNLILG